MSHIYKYVVCHFCSLAIFWFDAPPIIWAVKTSVSRVTCVIKASILVSTWLIKMIAISTPPDCSAMYLINSPLKP